MIILIEDTDSKHLIEIFQETPQVMSFLVMAEILQVILIIQFFLSFPFFRPPVCLIMHFPWHT